MATIHITSLPHTETTKAWCHCAYTEKVRKTASFLHDAGHTVFVYGGEENEARCTEHVTVVTREQQKEWFGKYDWERDVFNGWDPEADWWRRMNISASFEITNRAKPTDYVGIIAGRCQTPLAHLGLKALEWGIGYSGILGQEETHKCFESYAWMHHVMGLERRDDIQFFDTVIPNSFELEDFPMGKGGGDYVFLGRLIYRKGPHIAAEACKVLGAKLTLAGQGRHLNSPRKDRIQGDGVVIEGDVEHIGRVDAGKRANLLGGAKAVFVPTIYLEPFGGVAIEAMLCFPEEVQVEAKEVQRAYKKVFTGATVLLDSNGHTVQCTPEHPFATQRGWVEAGNLTKNDYLLINRRPQTGEILKGRIGEIVEGISFSGSSGDVRPNESDSGSHFRQGPENGTSQKLGRQDSHVPRHIIRGTTRLRGGLDRWGGHRDAQKNEPWGRAARQGGRVCRHPQHVPLYDAMAEAGAPHAEHLFEIATLGPRIRRGLGDGGVLVLPHSRAGIPSALQGNSSVPHGETPPNGNGHRIYRDHFVVAEDGFVDRSTACFIEDDSIYELAPITNIARREVTNLPVFNLGTSSGTYQANGFLTHNCGTPVITTDHGAFCEYVEEGVNGFRCRTLSDFVRAAELAPTLDRKKVRKSALKFTTTNVAPLYDDWFRRLDTLRDAGWYAKG